MLGYARFRAAYEVGFYPLYEKPPGLLVDFYLNYSAILSINSSLTVVLVSSFTTTGITER